MTVRTRKMAISKTSTLLVALFTGFVSLLLQTIALSTDYWTCSTFQGSVREFYTHNGSVIDPPRSLVRNRGLWRVCNIEYKYDNVSESYSGNDSNLGNEMAPAVATSTSLPDHKIQCTQVNLSIPPDGSEGGSNYFRIMYYSEKTAAIVACVCVGLQFCGFLTSVQGAWTMMTVLFTDCGIMYLFAAIKGLLCMTLFMISFAYETNEVDEILQYPDDYVLQYGWSFYLAWMAFGLTTVSGFLYLLIARAWHMQEVWAQPIKQEKGNTSKEESFSYRGKLMPKL